MPPSKIDIWLSGLEFGLGIGGWFASFYMTDTLDRGFIRFVCTFAPIAFAALLWW